MLVQKRRSHFLNNKIGALTCSAHNRSVIYWIKKPGIRRNFLPLTINFKESKHQTNSRINSNKLLQNKSLWNSHFKRHNNTLDHLICPYKDLQIFQLLRLTISCNYPVKEGQQKLYHLIKESLKSIQIQTKASMLPTL